MEDRCRSKNTMRSAQRFAFALIAALAFWTTGCSEKPAPQSGTAGGTAGDEASVLRVALDASFPPMEFTDDAGDIIGFDADLVRAVADEMGREITMQDFAWSGIFGALQNRSVDLIASSVTITDERKANFAFSAPYLVAGQVIAIRSADRDRYGSMRDLHGQKIGVQAGTTGHIRMEEEGDAVRIVAYETAPLAFIDLINEAVEAVMIDKPVAEYYATQKPELTGTITLIDELYSDERFGLVAHPDDVELVAKIDEALRAIEESGELDRIRERWFGTNAGR